jgi:hypothetical protein
MDIFRVSRRHFAGKGGKEKNFFKSFSFPPFLFPKAVCGTWTDFVRAPMGAQTIVNRQATGQGR